MMIVGEDGRPMVDESVDEWQEWERDIALLDRLMAHPEWQVADKLIRQKLEQYGELLANPTESRPKWLQGRSGDNILKGIGLGLRQLLALATAEKLLFKQKQEVRARIAKAALEQKWDPEQVRQYEARLMNAPFGVFGEGGDDA